jgi:phenylalanyl-tRNA synthetase alpha subunit
MEIIIIQDLQLCSRRSTNRRRSTSPFTESQRRIPSNLLRHGVSHPADRSIAKLTQRRRFTEMPTNRFVESAFWNFDAMFVPQQHPAREMQDTFYVKGMPPFPTPPPERTAYFLLDPVRALAPSPEYYERIRKIHEVGGYGSIGYRAPFSKDESEKLLLRTHTTSVSTAMLYEIANQPGGFKPAKMFSIDRVFRYVGSYIGE